MKTITHRRGFTLIELLVVVGIIALLATVVLYFINPKEFFAQARDSGRISSLNTLKVTLELARSNQISLGTANTLYLSIPDKTVTSTAGNQCQGLGLPSAPSGWTYHCASPSNYLKVDGTGWLPVNLAAIPGGGSPVNPLPADPVNATSSGFYYTYGVVGNSWELTAVLESNKEAAFAVNDGCPNPSQYELGTCGITPVIAGGGGTNGTWVMTTPMSISLNDGGAAAYNGYVYMIGGSLIYSNNNNTSSTYYAKINADGSLGAWAATAKLTQDVTDQPAVAYNGYVYSIGGIVNNVISANVNYSKINADGTLGAWASTTALPKERSAFPAVTYNGYIYALGGMAYIGPGSAPTSSVVYSKVNANGTLGAWTSTVAMPQVNSYEAAAAYNGYLYAVGGSSNTGPNVPQIVDYAKINADGTLGAWAATASLPSPGVSSGGAAVINGYLYTIGGSALTYAAQVNADGTLGSWAATSSLPVTTIRVPGIAYGNCLYALGGIVSFGATTTTYYYCSN